MSARREAPDAATRAAAIHARGVNVIADAGAGTGKTTLVVARLVELVAPADDRQAALSLARVAAITFTRKAAGELRFRIREALLRELARADLSSVRRDRLARALSLLDTAHVGTIHSFADRLLRLRPMEARLSPSYEIVEDEAELVAETFEVLMHAVEAGTLAAELGDRARSADAADAEDAIVDALRAGIRAETEELDHTERAGLDRLVARLVETRDVPPRLPIPSSRPAAAGGEAGRGGATQPPDAGRLRDLVEELAELARGSKGPGAGTRFIARTLARLRRACDEQDPVLVLKELLRIAGETRRLERELRKGNDFPGDDAGWHAWKAFKGDKNRHPVRETPLLDDLLGPYAQWMARRLVAIAPAVVAVYEQVKARHRAVDQVDLLLRLRDLLRDRLDVRAAYQRLFDHVFVDEFQDTDPLQAEVVLYLCEAGATAACWRDVRVAPGKLTIVGDPKQSIYRFRRADIAVYAEVRAIVARGPHLTAKLTANFRCAPGLIDFLNHRFDDLLGAAGSGKPAFDPVEGTVLNEPLLAGRAGSPAAAVEVIPLAAEPPARKDDYRRTEAAALAKWLRAVVEGGTRTIVDPATGAARPVRYGDVAILVGSTARLSLLFAALDLLGVPYVARGGQVFLEDPLHRQLLLGLRAIADRDDGVAQAALLRPPFFALDLGDLARARAAGEGSTDEGVLRARAAAALVHELRRRRLERSPGATARDLLERTALGRTVALGDNGAQRLDALRELCLALDTVAAAGALDFDGATARARAWIDAPVQLDPPRPVGTDAVQILTIHQAKGLEFPAVILWDACAELASRDRKAAFSVDRDGAWALALDGLEASEPADAELAARERRYLDAERRRLVYVAATRARDLLVLPVAGEPDERWISGRLVSAAPDALVTRLDPFVIGAEPAWATDQPAPAPRIPADGAALAAETGEAWRTAAARAAAPRTSPASVSGEAHRLAERAEVEAGDGLDEGEGGAALRPPRTSRFGNVFGETVHRAIGIALGDPTLAPATAVDRARRSTGLHQHLAEAAEDVRRALAALAAAGLRRAPGPDLQLEYPLALARDGQLLGGYVDLLAVAGDGTVTVIDFKTDAPPAGDVHATHPAYVAQVQGYMRMLEELGVAKAAVRGGLLFTAEMSIRWVAPLSRPLPPPAAGGEEEMEGRPAG